MHKPIDEEILPETLEILRARGGKWAAYTNIAMDSRDFGRTQFVKYGTDCSYSRPPEHFPDTEEAGLGWRYAHCGYVDLARGLIVEEEPS